MVEETLNKIGLDNDEAILYKTSLKLGECILADLAKESKMPRSTCYLVIDRLEEKGLISQIKRGSRIYYSAATPERLRSIVLEKEEDIKNQRKMIDQLIPALLSFSEKEKQPKIQHFSGKNGIKAILEDMLTSREVKDYYIGSTEHLVEAVGKEYLRKWMHRRVKAGIFSYGIRTKADEMDIPAFKPSRKMMREIRYAPDYCKFPLYICIYGNKVAMISSKEEYYGQIIESGDFATTLKSIFDVVWQASTK